MGRLMPDLSNAEISVEGEYGYCLVCGESFHWTQLTNLESGSYCHNDVPVAELYDVDGGTDMGHDTALERDTFGDAL